MRMSAGGYVVLAVAGICSICAVVCAGVMFAVLSLLHAIGEVLGAVFGSVVLLFRGGSK